MEKKTKTNLQLTCINTTCTGEPLLRSSIWLASFMERQTKAGADANETSPFGKRRWQAATQKPPERRADSRESWVNFAPHYCLCDGKISWSETMEAALAFFLFSRSEWSVDSGLIPLHCRHLDRNV